MVIVLLPFIYLAYVWNQLPAEVPIHWNFKGEIDRYGSKLELVLVLFLLPVLTYVILQVAPKIDPKGELKKMGNKFQRIKFALVSFTSIIAMLIIYFSKNQTLTNPNYILLVIGLLYIVFGNYAQTLKANYFIGIRTPWTLENETVWNKTHRIAGRLFFIGGIIVVLTSLILEKQQNFYLFFIITGIITIIPLVYSYLIFKNLKQTA